MSNPAPTLNQINAFNATQGTTIDFNIIGGTEVIRSNKIYIYDLSDNSLICTHLYVSTESIHELPPNTSSSIIYASGKSSADFTNNTQYYAQIQTFTDVGGTQGGSGLSIAKLFWCLPTPTLTLGTIPTTISTTSYNVSATYTPNTSGGATNEIQEFQFNLYSAIGALLQTSGVVLYGGGVDLSYNFSGLEVDSTYYVTLDVTTTQGMNVSAQSNTFTVSIDTPTMGSASVVNNGCDGYISVTSNLSSEYEHEESAEAGEIMSFTTDSVNDITELDVDFSPVQDGTPWMSAQDTEPYMFRAVPSQTEDFGHESDTIVGGTVAWNQLIQPKANTVMGITITVSNGKYTLNGTVSSSGGGRTGDLSDPRPNIVSGHKYLLRTTLDTSGISAFFLNLASNASTYFNLGKGNTIVSASFTGEAIFGANFVANAEINTSGYIQLFDLTQLFGTTIADYIYSLETANAGAGVAWFKKLFPKPYYAYNAGELISVKTSAHNTVGFNQLDPANTKIGGTYNPTVGNTINLDSTGATYTGTNPIEINVTAAWRGCCLISEPLVAGQQYEVAFKTSAPTTADKRTSQYLIDADNKVITSPYNWVGNSGDNVTRTFTPTESGLRCAVTIQSVSAQKITVTDPCVHLVWDGERDGEYEAYDKHSYPLDSSLTLRGIPKLDNGNLYYDGDTYESDGTVTRKYGIVDLGTLNWTYVADWGGSPAFYCGTLANSKVPATDGDTANMICGKLPVMSRNELYATSGNGISIPSNGNCSARASAYSTAADFKTAMSGVYLVYELATPTTETADPFINPQIVDPHGTEQYVGSSIPVGHETTYQRICPITGWTGCEVDVAGVNVWGGTLYCGSTYSELTFAKSAFLKKGTYIVSASNIKNATSWRFGFRLFESNGTVITSPMTKGFVSFNMTLYDTYSSNTVCLQSNNVTYTSIQMTLTRDAYVGCMLGFGDVTESTTTADFQIELGSTATTYHAYTGTTYPVSWQTEAGTVYGGKLDVVSGVLTVTRGYSDLGSQGISWGYNNGIFYAQMQNMKQPTTADERKAGIMCSQYPPSTVTALNSSMDDKSMLRASGYIYIRDTSYTDAQTFKTAMNGVQLVYELATPIEISLTPQQMQTLSGQNNIWSNTNGGMYLVYQLPITSLLVKRRDVADISGKWLTLYSTPIAQASDMDFTFIDFLNQYGKTYQYALVPVLAQNQSGVIVQIEGGYTVSDNVDSIFDGVYIADQTNVERVKAGVGYGNIDMNQGVGSITPIGSKYPIVITNSQNQYHNGSVRGTIVPNDFYSNGNLSRMDIVNKRDELEQFLTNKRAKIIKDWNGKMWLVMIMSNVACSFDDNYGMGMVSFSADWLEVGDPTSQQDLYNAGLINVGGV